MKGRGIYGDGEVSSEREREFWRGTRNSREGEGCRETKEGERSRGRERDLGRGRWIKGEGVGSSERERYLGSGREI